MALLAEPKPPKSHENNGNIKAVSSLLHPFAMVIRAIRSAYSILKENRRNPS